MLIRSQGADDSTQIQGRVKIRSDSKNVTSKDLRNFDPRSFKD